MHSYCHHRGHHSGSSSSSSSSSSIISSRGREMIGSSGTTTRDSSFLCLLAIYAAHVVLFHVLEVAPRLVDLQQRQLWLTTAPHWDSAAATPELPIDSGLSGQHNGTVAGDVRGTGTTRTVGIDASSDLLSGQLRNEVFTTASSQLAWDSSSMMTAGSAGYPKIDLDLLFLLTWIQRIKNVFSTIALSSSTWGIISGCAIFLLTYTDRDNTLQA